MSPRILLSHIGNRNLLWQGKTHFAMVKSGETPFDFRSFTRTLWEQFDETQAQLQTNILDTLLEAQGETLSQVILLSSDQPPGLRNDQDTLYVGLILQRLLAQSYPNLRIEHRIIQAPVTDTNQLLRAYRSLLHEIRQQHPEVPLMLCDAGGTAQQKAALKIMLEFLFDPEDYVVYYVAQGLDYQSELQEVQPVEYRWIIDAEQIQGLVQQGNYQGALDLYGRHHRKARDSTLWKLLQFAQYRKERLRADARVYTDPSLYPEAWYARQGFLQDYRVSLAVGNQQAWAVPFLGREAYFELCEILALVQFQLSCKNYTQVVMHFTRFIENYLRFCLIRQFACPYDHSNGQGMRRLLQLASADATIRQHFGKREIKAGLSTQLLVCAQHPDPTHQRLLTYLRSLLQHLNPLFRQQRKGPPFALNSVRNQIAHQGLGVAEATFIGIPGIVRAILEASRVLGMPPVNPYVEMNTAIEDLLQSQSFH